MKREKLGRKEIEKVFCDYAKLFSKLTNKTNKLTEKERLNIQNRFKNGYKIAEFYMFNKNKVDENDVYFVFIEWKLEELKKIDKQVKEKKKK
ncbi:hypothetical protein JNUCC83_01420 [Vagococcus sp. JNUCC 83]